MWFFCWQGWKESFVHSTYSDSVSLRRRVHCTKCSAKQRFANSFHKKIAFAIFWQGWKESNPPLEFWRLLFYRWTTPLCSNVFLVYHKNNKCVNKFSQQKNRTMRFLLLIIFCLNCKITLWVLTNWTNSRCFFSNYNVSTICTLPNCIAFFWEDQPIFNIV